MKESASGTFGRRRPERVLHLNLVEVSVEAVARHQLVMRTLLDDPPLLQNNNLICVANRR